MPADPARGDVVLAAAARVEPAPADAAPADAVLADAVLAAVTSSERLPVRSVHLRLCVARTDAGGFERRSGRAELGDEL